MQFKDEFTIGLRCSKDSALNVLKRYTNKKGHSPSFTGIKPFSGEIKDDVFEIRNIGMRYHFIINVRVTEIDNGCRLIISTKAESIEKGFFIVGLTFALFLSVASIGNSIVTSTFGMVTVFPIIFSVFWTSIFFLRHKIYFNETKRRFNRIFEMYLIRD